MIEVLIVSVPFFKKIWDREIWEEWGGGSKREEEEVCFFICFCTTSIWVANVSTD